MTLEEAKHRAACRRAWAFIWWQVINPLTCNPSARHSDELITQAVAWGQKKRWFRP